MDGGSVGQPRNLRRRCPTLPALPAVDEIGWLSVSRDGPVPFIQPSNARRK